MSCPPEGIGATALFSGEFAAATPSASTRPPTVILFESAMLLGNHSEPERPAGIVAIAAILGVTGGISLVLAILLISHAVPLSYGSVLLQGGLEQSGPLAFLLYGAIALLLAWFLTRRKRWARRLTILLAGVGVALAVPAISSAVADGRIYAIVREGSQIMARVAIIFYLTQPAVREWFSALPA